MPPPPPGPSHTPYPPYAPYPAPYPAYQPYPAYPPPYGYGYGYPVRRTNGMAIAALIMIFVFSPLAIVFGFIARHQIRRTGEDGDGMAIAGIAVGIAFTLIYVLMVVFIVLAIIAGMHNQPYPGAVTTAWLI
jgi:hypothetical protein